MAHQVNLKFSIDRVEIELDLTSLDRQLLDVTLHFSIGTNMIQNKCILIIDDDEDIREVTQLTLELEGGWDVLTASSGTEGITLAERERPDAILLDVMMPEMDGIATIDLLKRNPRTKSIPVLFLTAKGQADTLTEWSKLGVTATISKPFDPLRLVPQIRQILQWN